MSGRQSPWGSMFDTRHEFFRPLWVRLLVLAVAGGWAGVEFWRGDLLWGVIFAVFAGMGFYGFFIDPKRPSAQPPPE